jgi:NTE family protein
MILAKKKISKKFNVGLVLSGGGARGFAHIGAIKAMNEAGIFPDVISGVSAGAIAAALIADGHKPDDILKMFMQTKLHKIVEMVIPKKGLLKMTGLLKIISGNLRATTFEELSIPVYIGATDLNNGKIVYFSKGDLLKPIMASATVPVLFTPMKIGNVNYVDGGVLNNFPIEPLEEKCHFIIGIHVNPFGYIEDFNSIMSVAERSFHLSISTHIGKRVNKCDIFIEPAGLQKYRLLDVAKINEIFQLGYMETKRILKENKEKVSLIIS